MKRLTVLTVALVALALVLLWTRREAPAPAMPADESSRAAPEAGPLQEREPPQPTVTRVQAAGTARLILTLTTQDGTPIAGVDALAYNVATLPDDPVPPTLHTDADGRVEFEVAPASYVLLLNAQRKARPDLAREVVELNDVPEGITERTVVLQALDAGVDVLIFDDLGHPVPDVVLRVMGRDETVRTNTQGRASFGALPPRAVSIEIVEAPRSVAVPYGFRRNCELQKYTIREETIHLERTGSLRLKVKMHGPGTGRATATVSVAGADTKFGSPLERQSLTVPGGAVVDHLVPGEHTVWFELGADEAYGLPGRQQVQIRPGAESAVEFALESRPGVLSGTVTDAQGRPVPRIAMSVLIRDPQTADPTAWPESKVARTDAQGRFDFKGLPERMVWLQVQVHISPGVHYRYFGSFDAPYLETPPTRDLTVILQPGFGIRGVVRDASGTPVQSGDVAIDRAAYAVETTVSVEDDHGRFEFRHLRPGRYRLHYRDRNGAQASEIRVVDVGASSTAPEYVEVELTTR